MSNNNTTDPAFKVVPRRQACFLIWRIEKLKVVAVPKEKYGSFFKGDSYIILAVKEIKGRLDSHLHFWLGSDTSQDEAGVAAYKTVELDDYLGGTPVQHREVEEKESPIFMKYFQSKGGVTYLEGGVASGFNHVEHTFQERLLHVKGKKTPRVRQVPISWDSMNDGDAFILDLGAVLFCWLGKEVSTSEKLKCMAYARNLRDERGKGDVVTIESGEEKDMTEDELKLFEEKLPLGSRSVKSASEGGQDEAFERKAGAQLKLYLCSDDSGTLKVTEKKGGPLVKGDLDTNDSYIVDNGEAGVYAWIGRKATSDERKEAMRNAMGFIDKKGYSKNTPVTKVVEGGETTEFKAIFKSWPEPKPTGKAYNTSRIAKTIQTKFDAATLHENPSMAAETKMVDDGSGKIQIWRIKDFDMEPLDQKYFGQFYGGDCYIILYTYLVNGKENYIIYYWQGRKSSADEKGTSALKTVELDDSMGGAPVQIRVCQGKEPPHFMAMFNGKMIVFEGGHAGWGSEEEGPGDTYLMQVRGTSKLNTKAEQVDCRAASLNSNDVFVLFTKKDVYIWSGKGSTGDEREMAKHIATINPRSPSMQLEGQEKADFWAALGGKEEYASDKRLAEPETNHPARLFQCSNASGRFVVEEVPDFNQDDLCTDDVMLLDAFDTVFLWIGEGANKAEKKQAETSAIEYIATDPSGRDPDTPIVKVKQGFEPPTFTGFFGAWDNDLWSNNKTYAELKKELGEENVGVSVVKQAQQNGGGGFSDVKKYSYEDLIKQEDDGLPEGIDTGSKEIYLTEEEFQSVFKMSYTDFIAKPQWKQRELKKAVKLF
ncbi:unnamed protein product [Owenia fusiformis]|uniref:Uncharacterized protein n=1 Tax=Owenia fusiformis TaxID=6347 RepID=A0A8J1TSU5_OWEFU|nr:unnamed protein product [Owenia fusiformis]